MSLDGLPGNNTLFGLVQHNGKFREDQDDKCKEKDQGKGKLETLNQSQKERDKIELSLLDFQANTHYWD